MAGPSTQVQAQVKVPVPVPASEAPPGSDRVPPSRAGTGGIVALVLAAGCGAGAIVGKVPVALPGLQHDMGLSLVQGGVLIAFMLLAAVLTGVVAGMVADRFGQRRVMVAGLVTLAAGGLLGAASHGFPMLLASRALESAGFLATVLPAPALLVRLVAPVRQRAVMGLWACYMPTGMAAMLFIGPAAIAAIGWRGVWVAGAVMTAVLAWLIRRRLPDDPQRIVDAPDAAALVRQTLGSPRPWLLAACFGCYAGQWMSIFSFLPTMYQQQGVAATTAGWLTAFGVLANTIGNVGGGALIARGIARHRIIATASIVMGAAGWLLFAAPVPFAIAYAALIAFSAFGGLVPGVLFASTPAFAPSPQTISTTNGLMQQGSAIGQFLTPPLLAAVVSVSGGWSVGWRVTGALALVNLGLAFVIARHRAR